MSQRSRASARQREQIGFMGFMKAQKQMPSSWERLSVLVEKGPQVMPAESGSVPDIGRFIGSESTFFSRDGLMEKEGNCSYLISP